MVFNWFDLVVLFGILQGIVAAAIIIFAQKKMSLTRKLLAAVLFVFSLLNFKIAIHTLHLWEVPALRYFPLAIDLLIQPLLYFYTASLVNNTYSVARKSAWHFLPAILLMVHAMAVYIATLTVSNLVAKDIIAEHWHFNLVKSVEDDFSVASTIIYGVLAFRLVQGYRRRLFQNISDSSYKNFTWLRYLLLFTAVLGVGVMVNILLDQLLRFSASHFFHWQLFYIYLSGLIYFVAVRSYNSSQPVLPITEKQVVPEPTQTSSKYSEDEMLLAQTAIVAAFEKNKLYLRSELTLAILAAHLKLNPALVSEAINKKCNKSFRTLVNDYRIDEVKKRLANEDIRRLSILGIAIDCGFNSEASFYRVFKTATGLSPKSYLAQLNGKPDQESAL